MTRKIIYIISYSFSLNNYDESINYNIIKITNGEK